MLLAAMRNERSGWAWASLILQGFLFLDSSWGLLQFLLSWQTYAHYGVRMFPLVLRLIAFSAATGISLFGLWNSKAWGWAFACLTDAATCLLSLSSLVQFPFLVRSPKWIVYSLSDLAAFALLLHRPVRNFFFRRAATQPHIRAPQATRPVTVAASAGFALAASKAGRVPLPRRFLRVLVYFAVAVVVVCLATSFGVTLLLGSKAGGTRGFLAISIFAFGYGAVPSFLFVLLLTLAGGLAGPRKLWAWILVGATLAPALTLALGTLALSVQASPQRPDLVFRAALAGPQYLSETPWLMIPIGLVSAFLCFQMFPWSFGE